MSQLALLRGERFAPFFWTQFLGALNDNLFQNALVILFAFGGTAPLVSPDTPLNLAAGGPAPRGSPATLLTLAGVIFILPFFLFSATSGQLSARFEKARVIRAV